MKSERPTTARRSSERKPARPVAGDGPAQAAAAPEADPQLAIPSDMRREMIAAAAYFRAERRAFQGGDAEADWLAAEIEIDTMLQQRLRPAAAPEEPQRKAWEQKLEAQLGEWDGKLDEIAAAAAKAKAHARSEIEAQLEALRAKRASLRDQLEALRQRASGAGDDLKQGIEKAWGDMRQALDHIQARFKK